MSDPALGLTMLGLIVIAIMMGFPTAFTLMGLGMFFGYVAFYDDAHHWLDNQIFDLFVQRTYGVMNNETLLSIPLFVLMGYIMERAALVDKMFFSVQLAFRRLPASLAVTTMLICAFWGIASGIVGAVVVLMGVIAMRPMLKAGYDVRLASGVITAGGTLGILIPPSVMLIVYAAVAGQSIVKLYAAAMLPGFFLTLLYLIYIIGWALLDPKVAPPLPPDQYRIAVPDWIQRLQRGPSRRVIGTLFLSVLRPSSLSAGRAPDGAAATYGQIVSNALAALLPVAIVAAIFASAWWYVVIHNAQQAAIAPVTTINATSNTVELGASETPGKRGRPESPQELGDPQETSEDAPVGADSPLQPIVSDLAGSAADTPQGKMPEHFFEWFWASAALSALLLAVYYWRMDGEQLEILKLLALSVMPLGVLTFVVLAVILFGITTASESAGIGALGAVYLAALSKYSRRALWASLAGAIIGVAFGMVRGDLVTLIVAGSLGAAFAGSGVPFAWDLATGRRELAGVLKESTYLTAKTTAMVCWLFVGSALFSAVFALHGGQQLIEKWVLSLNLSPVQFMLVSQTIIFLLGWPLEWTEIIVIFVPIFIPLLDHFNVDPVLFATLVAVNLQAAFLSPPVAMSAFYLKGVSPPHVTLNQIFAGMMPYMLIIIICMVIMYVWPGMTLWLPNFLYGA